jgi:hypothetical protein
MVVDIVARVSGLEQGGCNFVIQNSTEYYIKSKTLYTSDFSSPTQPPLSCTVRAGAKTNTTIG